MTTQLARTPSDTRTPGLTLSRGHVLIFEHARDVPMGFWERGFSDSWKDFQYYDLIEQTMRRGFDYRYLLVFDKNDRPLALQPLLLATQDLAISAGANVARLVAKLRTYWPHFLQSRIALAGCLVGDGKMGTMESDETASPLVAEALEKYSGSVGVRLVGFKDFPARMRSDLSSLNQAGYVRVTGFPSLILDLNFASFEEYAIKQLSRATRKNLRRKFRAADAVSPAISFEVWTDAEQIIDEIYPLYLAVAETSAIQFEIFTREYFLEAGRSAPGKFRYFIWRQGSRAVAFSFCTIWDGTLYDNDIGLDYSVAYELNLYYVTFRDLLNWALVNGLHRYASAPFNYDPKLRLRLEPQEVDVYVKHTSPWVNPFIKAFARVFEPARTDPVLRRHLHLFR